MSFPIKVNEIFTPRNPDVNTKMYVSRPDLEKCLYRSIEGSMHSFLFGESGNGKSWLYKKVFLEKGVNYVVANCANASRKKSITDEIYSVCIPPGSTLKKSYKETKTAGVNVVGKAELSHQGEYEVIQTDKLLSAFEALNKISSSEKSVIVLDNVETILRNETLMSELSDIIILLDDSIYAKYLVKFLIVGVPNEVLKYFSSTKNPSSVGNRIEELPRVTGLSDRQIGRFIELGFNKYLNISLTDDQKEMLTQHIFNITLGVPQRMHEICECIAYEIEDNNYVFDETLLEKADSKWLFKGLRECYSVIEKHMNSSETLEGRRNQVLYAIGKSNTHQYSTNKIGEIISAEFPNSSPESNSGIGQVLGYLSKGDNPILTKTSSNNFYVICDPRYLMCIRLVLYKDKASDQVKKKEFKIH